MPPILDSVHPELKHVASKIPSFSFGPATQWLIRLAALLLPGGRPLPAELAKAVVIDDLRIPAPEAGLTIRLRICRPRGRAASKGIPVLFWIHGGGYIMGKPEQEDAFSAGVAQALGIAVVAVQYRLAPEHPFPAGLDDCLAGLQWVHDHAAVLGVQADRIAIGGSSAGAGIAAALAQRIHDQGEFSLAAQSLLYPMLDDRTAVEPAPDAPANILWNRKSNRFGWRSYLGRRFGAETLPDYAAAARRPDLTGLPPAWIGVGALDLFHDEDVAYAATLQAAGVPCDLVVVPGAFHAFDMFAPDAPIVRTFRASQLASLEAHLFPSGAEAA